MKTSKVPSALSSLCLLLLQILHVQGLEHDVCKVQHVKFGCYSDVRFQETLGEMLFQDRCKVCPKYGGELIDWANYGDYVKRLACRCATAAKSKGYTYFGLQFYGVCYSGPDSVSLYNKYGRSAKCISQDQTACDDENSDECVGHGNANYIYRI